MARLALKIFCRKIEIKKSYLLWEHGPLLITANHPNSFLDAVIIGCLFKEPVHYLTRGDAFNKAWHNTLLRLLNMIPVYRLSEGKENLSLNEEAFQKSAKILSGGGIVLIFIEGICQHTHELQTFKKGAARIAIDSSHIEKFSIMPLGIAYDSFISVGKKINIHIGEPIPVKKLLPFDDEGKNMRHFNAVLYDAISSLVVVPENKTPDKRSIFFISMAMLGYALHIVLYAGLKKIIRKKTEETVFYDSVLFGVLLFVYPLYLLLFSALLILLKLPLLFVLIIFFLHPLTAWFAVRGWGDKK